MAADQVHYHRTGRHISGGLNGMETGEVLLIYSELQFSESFWLIMGFTAQLLFSARFLVQWIASERAGMSVVPILFWWLSIIGGILLLGYAIRRRSSSVHRWPSAAAELRWA